MKFEDTVCASPAAFGRWNSFRLIVKWTAEPDGFLRAYCNGKLIYNIVGQAAAAPHCGTEQKLQCETRRVDITRPVQWPLGPRLAGFGAGFRSHGQQSPFQKFPKGGFEMRARDIYCGRPRD